jgi:hypothetical protein
MKFLLIPCSPRVRRRLLASPAAALLLALVAGCASPAPPQPPSLNLPEIVKDLTAERVGDEVRLHWTTPQNTTDRIAVKGAMTAEICRITLAAPTCTPVKRIPIQAGKSQTTDTLPSTLTANPPALLAYRVQILNIHDHSAGFSSEAFAPSGAAPPPVEQLRATPTGDGALLEWQPRNTSAQVELDRLPLTPEGDVIEPAASGKSSSKAPRATTKKPADTPKKPVSSSSPPSSPKPLQMKPSTPTEVKLRSPARSTDAGGTIDHTAQRSISYQYTAQRVLPVSLAGHALELRSAISAPVTLTMRDIFPPQAPTGLEAVPGGATAADRSIDLSWTPNPEGDLAGYFVYRQEVDSKGEVAGTATRLNQTPVVGPAYRDQTAMAGRRYAYRVSAVDTAGNESPRSDEVQETLREQ